MVGNLKLFQQLEHLKLKMHFGDVFLTHPMLLQYTFDKWNPGISGILYKPPYNIYLVEPNMVPTSNKT